MAVLPALPLSQLCRERTLAFLPVLLVQGGSGPALTMATAVSSTLLSCQAASSSSELPSSTPITAQTSLDAIGQSHLQD